MKSLTLSRLALCALCGASLFALLDASPSHAQQRWMRNYGYGERDDGNSVQQTSDGGYIVAGSSYDYGRPRDVFVVKTNSAGDSLWAKLYGGSNSDVGFCIKQTSDGGYIITGNTQNTGYVDVWLIKLNASGDTLWTRSFPQDTLGTQEGGYSVQQTSDGGYIVLGSASSYPRGDNNFYLIKTNASGNISWTRTYGDTMNDEGRAVQQTQEGGYILAGSTTSFGAGGSDVWLIKTDASGDTLWTKTYGGTDDDWGWSVQQTSDGGYIIAGTTLSFGVGWSNIFLIKTDASGDTLWMRTYGGTEREEGRSVRQTQDGGYIIAGSTLSFGAGEYDFYLVKTDASGNVLWARTHGGLGSDWGYSVQQTQDGGYILAGTTQSYTYRDDILLVKTDANGYVGVGEEEGRRDRDPTRKGVRAFPNPFTSFASVPGHEGERFTLYDVSGRKVGTYRGDRVGEGLAPGVYFVRGQTTTSTPLRIVKVR